MTIRIRLDAIMRERGITATQLSEQTGITEAAISEWRTNKVVRISLKTLNTLCDALKVTPGDLLVND
jgi:putative transcriptional regulator